MPTPPGRRAPLDRPSVLAAAVALVAAAIDPAVRAALTRVVPVRTRGPR